MLSAKDQNYVRYLLITDKADDEAQRIRFIEREAERLGMTALELVNRVDRNHPVAHRLRQQAQQPALAAPLPAADDSAERIKAKKRWSNPMYRTRF